MILPFYHSGMGRVMPEHGRIPRVGREVDITVGQPLDMSDLTCRCGQPGLDQKQARQLTTWRYRPSMRSEVLLRMQRWSSLRGCCNALSAVESA